MLVQTGQDMVTAEQQIPIATDARKLIETLDMKALQESRLVTKAEKPVEDILATIIMICAKRQLANLDRFIEEIQLFDKINLTEEHIKLISGIIDNVQLENSSLNQTSYYNAILTLYKWVKRVLQYHTVLLKKVRPIHQKYKEIEEDILEQDQKIILLDNKSQILSRELERISKIFETSVEHQLTLNGTNQIYYEWLSNGVLPLEMKNYTIIIKSIEYSPLLIDLFGQYNHWMEKYYKLQKIDLDDQTSKDQNLMKNLIELTFPIHSPLVTKLLDELFQQISSKTSLKLNEYQFEIP
ncbi:unnamed protein product [Adineta steineri]|uniref:Dynein heavy chain coiled coil stalk domain-containing protein n=1 Tax=Adineta steineri TaxID=433720 RepID=A0A815X181_9BILA|nr:unnamed protein product [Adineta steineri]CAF1660510.1 unnamed protein product [Adineta steineri]